jgi:hypothetical protein
VRRQGEGGAAPQRLALKLVLGEDESIELKSEYEAISQLPAGVAQHTVGVVADSYFTPPLQQPPPLPVAAYLMPIVGQPFHHWEDIPEAAGKLMLESLSELHASGLVHGDARYRNVVYVELAVPAGPLNSTNYRWVDFRSVGFSTSASIRHDVNSFLQSMERTASPAAVTLYGDQAYRNTWSPEERIQTVGQLWTNQVA